MVYRAYRVPYEWVPQLDTPKQTAIKPVDVKTFRVPGAGPLGCQNITKVEGTQEFQAGADNLCITGADDENQH